MHQPITRAMPHHNNMQPRRHQQQQAHWDNKPADHLLSQWRLFRFSHSLSFPQVAHAATSPFNYATNKFWRLTSQIAARYANDTNNSSRSSHVSSSAGVSAPRGLNNIPTQLQTTTSGILTRDLTLSSFRPATTDQADHAVAMRLLRAPERCRRRRRRRREDEANAPQNAIRRANSTATTSSSSSADEECSQDEQSANSADANGSLWPMTMSCRVCMQDSIIQSPSMARAELDMVRPCRCTGTVAWVHNSCLASWVFMDNVGGPGPAAHPKCELCSTRYAFHLRRRPFRQWAMSLVSHSALFWAVSLAALPLPTLNFLCNVHALRFGKFLSICDSTDFNELKWCATSLAGMVMFWCANDYCRFLETWRGGATSASTTKAGLFIYMGICVLCLSSNDLRRTWRKWRSAQFEVDFEDFAPPPPPSPSLTPQLSKSIALCAVSTDEKPLNSSNVVALADAAQR